DARPERLLSISLRGLLPHHACRSRDHRLSPSFWIVLARRRAIIDLTAMVSILRRQAGDATMAAANASHVHRQIARVSRRLFVQSLFDALVWCWAGALLLAASWCLAEAHVLSAPPSWLRWAIAGGLAGMGTVFAVVFTLWRWPTRLDAALSLD